MGCWEETCALTSAPIYSGEPCVMVILEPFPAVHKGTYNDYGWIEELDQVRYEDKMHNLPSCIFFHVSAWDWALLEYQKLTSYEKRGTTDFEHVCRIAGLMRRDVFSAQKFRGHQEFNHWEKRESFLDLQQHILNKHKEIIYEADEADD